MYSKILYSPDYFKNIGENPKNFGWADEQQNAECLNKIQNGNGKNETWLVFMVHGFGGGLEDDTFLNPLRDSVLAK